MKFALPAAGAVIVALLGVIGYLVYDQNQPEPDLPASQTIQQDTVLKGPGGELGASIQVYVNEQDLVAFIELIDVDLTRNTRKVVWAYADNQELAQIYKKFEATKVGDTPWLSANPEQNKRQLSIINGAYSCVAVTDTPLPKLMPGMEQQIKYVCVVAVPPDYGKFSGYLSAWLTRVPTDEEVHRVVERMRGFSSRIY